MKNYVQIYADPCFISQRLKDIDPNYIILFNRRKNKFEVHSLSQYDGSYCFTIPYSCLDERTLFYALKTRAENINALIKEIEEDNQKLQKQNFKQAKNKLEEALS